MRACPQCGGTYPVAEGFCPMDGSRLRTSHGPLAGGHDDDPFAVSLLGRVLDRRYRLDEIIGLGGMGVVFRATHVLIGKVLAVKVLRREHAHGDVARRFLLEAQLASSLKHPNVVDISDFGELEEGWAYYAMEHLVGRTLADRIDRDGPIPPADAIAIALQICHGMAAAHAQGVVHRDLKPDNVFLAAPRPGKDAPVVKLLDFGIAREGPRRITAMGTVLGTPEYMAPEQALGGEIDHRVDLYALGVSLFEMLTASVPFRHPQIAQVIDQQIHAPPPSIGARKPELAELHRIDDVVQSLLAKSRDDRPPTAEAVATALIGAIGSDLGRDTAERLKRQTIAIGSGLIAESLEAPAPPQWSEPTAWSGTPSAGVRAAGADPLLVSGPVPTVPRGGVAFRPQSPSPARPVAIGAVAAMFAGAVTFAAAHWLREPSRVESPASDVASDAATPTIAAPSTNDLQATSPPRIPARVTPITAAPSSAPAPVTPVAATASDDLAANDDSGKPETTVTRSSTKRRSKADPSTGTAPAEARPTARESDPPSTRPPTSGGGDSPPTPAEPAVPPAPEPKPDRRTPGDLKDPFPAN
ncbi:MAG TPA: protein kinase [Nannocystaceae bacterium]|nr:protein kinase [Nannocystaceae bacterium]